MTPLAVTRPHPLQLCQRWLRREPHENIDTLPSRADNHQPRALRSSLRRARAFPNRHPASTLSPPFHTSLTHIPQHSSLQRGGTIRLTASTSFRKTQSRATTRITSLINLKLDDFFGLSEYAWTPPTREDAPSMYLYELVNWLTTVVDSLQISDANKHEAYHAAAAYIAQCLMVRPAPVRLTSSLKFLE
jgi:hypothetical protein